jgi:LPXTG-motif cell wall-anchored protein
MTDHTQSFASFAILGIGGLLLFSGALLIWFRRSGYL